MLLLLACTDGEPAVQDPAPWESAESVALEPLRPLVTTALQTRGWRIEVHPDRPLAAVLAEDRVLLLDSRWQHLDTAHCLKNTYPYIGPQGQCNEGEVELRRGAWITGSPQAVAFDGDIAAVLDHGVLYRSNVNVLQENPFDWMRLDDGVPLDPVPTEVDYITLEDGKLGVHGTRANFYEEGDNGFVLVADTETEPWSSDAVDGELRYVLNAEGFLQGDLQHEVATPVDIAVTAAHEVLLLYDNRVEVYLDEVSLLDNETVLAVFNTTFVEKPKSPIEDLPCEGDDLSVASALETAAANREMLDDLPGCHALGITPHHLRRVRSCGFWDQAEVALGERTEVGVLFHDEASCPPSNAGGAACYADFLASEAALVEIAEPTWIGGLSANADAGHDWVQGIVDADLPPVVPFLGMSARWDINHFQDPRSKEAWPLTYADWSRPVYASSAMDPFEGGPVGLFSGDARSLFTLDGCPNLLLRECQVLAQGNGANVVRSGDIIQATLSLHRALAADAEQGSWTWHLPDIGTWDYVEGCTVTDRVWEGDCQAALLQQWLMDVHARYVLNGLAAWTPPSQL